MQDLQIRDSQIEDSEFVDSGFVDSGFVDSGFVDAGYSSDELIKIERVSLVKTQEEVVQSIFKYDFIIILTPLPSRKTRRF